ncbi:MAG: hypothetical protein OXU19_15935 [bacterium]|nr:hypothetical protein [bacterium]
MKGARRHCIYCAPGTWEKIRRRARKADMPVSRFGVLCCLKADEEGTPEPVQPTGHALAIPPDQQRRLYADIEIIWRAGHIMLDESKAAGIGVFMSDVMRFLRLTEAEEGG